MEHYTVGDALIVIGILLFCGVLFYTLLKYLGGGFSWQNKNKTEKDSDIWTWLGK